MPIILMLGLIAGLYLVCLLFRLAVHALPVYVALTLGFTVRAHGSGVVAAILIGLVSGVATLAIGRVAFERARAPAARLLIAAAFVGPAGIAGYQAVHGIGGLVFGAGVMLNGVSLTSAVIIAAMAWAQLARAAHSPPAPLTSFRAAATTDCDLRVETSR